MKPTIDDVAKLAGVARATVSRVLNNQPNVRDKVRAEVMRAVLTLGYRVNLQARNLAGRQTMRIGLIHASHFEREAYSFFGWTLELGATIAAASRGAQLVSHIIDENDPGYAARIIDSLRDDQCDGALLAPPFADDVELLHALMAFGIKIVCIAAGRHVEGLVNVIGIDDRQAGRDVGEHLLARGHCNFGFIKGLQDHKSAEERYVGFLDALHEAGLGAEAVTTERGAFNYRSGHDCAEHILAINRGITALVCANDDMAAGALLAIHKLGLRIPEDIAVTGFDDTPVSGVVWPPLTTIHQPLRSIGKRAVEMLVERASEAPAFSASREFVPHRLIVRESSMADARSI